MQCPIDGTALQMTERNGIEIDYCPQCRGVWLDRGELDKILERAAQPAVPQGQPFSDPGSRPGRAFPTTMGGERDYREERRYDGDDDRYRDPRYGSEDDRYRDPRYGGKKKRRESFLDDLFDFG